MSVMRDQYIEYNAESLSSSKSLFQARPSNENSISECLSVLPF